MANYQPKNPDYEHRVRDSFARQGIMAHIGAQMSELSPGRCTIQLTHRPEVTQQHGYFHGGVIGMIADSAGGYAGFTLMAADASVLTVEYKLNLLAPGDGEALVAEGHVIKAGRNLVIARADVFAIRGGVRHQCATMLQTLMTMHGRADA